MTDGSAIRTRDLRRRYGSLEAVDGLDLDVPRGSVFGLLGRNGAGKTTTIRMLLGLLRRDSGLVEVLGLDPEVDGLALRHRIGYVPDSPQLYDWMTVDEIVGFTSGFYDNWNSGHVNRLLKDFGLPGGMKVKQMSRGMAARLTLTLALGHEPELLILDEPAAGLDAIVRRDFLESIVRLIQEEGRTVLLSSHLVHEVERVADRVAVIEGGRVLACDELDAFKGRVKKLLVRYAGEEAQLESLAGVRDVAGVGERRLVTTTGDEAENRAALAALGAEVVDVVDMSLEDSFIELVREHVEREGARA